MVEKKKSKLPITIFELVVYILAGLLALWGLTYMCLGFACNFAKYNSALVEANKTLRDNANGLGFLGQGLIIIAVGITLAVIVLCVNAKTTDREYEKEQRRKAARFNRRNQNEEVEETVVDVETTPVE